MIRNMDTLKSSKTKANNSKKRTLISNTKKIQNQGLSVRKTPPHEKMKNKKKIKLPY